jgi:hypothetical protein
MTDANNQTEKSTNEIILTVEYWWGNAWFWIGQVYLLLLAWGGWWALPGIIQKGRYVLATMMALGIPCLILIVVDFVFTKQFLFYEDRLVKEWYFFGRRTIYYRRMRVRCTPSHLKWLSTGHAFVEDRGNLMAILFQIGIAYNGRYIAPDAAKKIDTIVNYLTGDSEENPRPCIKAALPKEVLCQQDP